VKVPGPGLADGSGWRFLRQVELISSEHQHLSLEPVKRTC
jgi:hypothetical protein